MSPFYTSLLLLANVCFVFSAMTNNTVHQLTEHLLEASVQRDWIRAKNFISKHTIISYHSVLPFGGVYVGRKGALSLIYRSRVVFHMDDAATTCKVLYVDEDHQRSAIYCRYSGTFRKTGNMVQNVASVTFISWDLGKVRSMNIVDKNPDVLARAVRTPAEQTWYHLQDIMALTGPLSNETLAMISENLQIRLLNVHPRSLIPLSLEAVHRCQQGEHSEWFSGEEEIRNYPAGRVSREPEGDVLLQGYSGLRDFEQSMAWALMRTKGVEVLYADDTTVVTKHMLGKTKLNKYLFRTFSREGFIGHSGIKMTSIYMTSRFDANGKLYDLRVLINRPIERANLWAAVMKYRAPFGEEARMSIMSNPCLSRSFRRLRHRAHSRCGSGYRRSGSMLGTAIPAEHSADDSYGVQFEYENGLEDDNL